MFCALLHYNTTTILATAKHKNKKMQNFALFKINLNKQHEQTKNKKLQKNTGIFVPTILCKHSIYYASIAFDKKKPPIELTKGGIELLGY